jgi:hypothetical protein
LPGGFEPFRLIFISALVPPYSACHLYYPSRRQPTRAFAVLVDGLRYRD